ncbi:MAG: nucleoside-diphosphate-sugar epimerase [Crocinitomicaceae bacterium]|jgi:nucleoside-diphosphate-sugar epimerase
MLNEIGNYYKDKTILVTGGAGAIGRNLSEKLAVLGAKKVIIFDNLSSAYEWNIPNYENVSFVNGDIRNENDLIRVFHYKPQIVFHLAAFFANQNSVDYPLVNEDVNTVGLIKLLEYSNLSGAVEKFVFTNSEGGAYGDESKLPYQEDDISIDLGSPYYISKLSGEAYCKYYHKHYDLPVSIVRLFNSYGPGEVSGQYRNVIPNFIYWALKNQTLPLTGDDRIARDFVFALDTVEGILRAGYYKEAVGESINIATGNPIKIYDLAAMINEKTGNKGGVKVIGKRKWDKRPSIYGDTTKAEKLLKFKPNSDFEQGIDETIEWFKENWENIENSTDFPPGLSSALDS